MYFDRRFWLGSSNTQYGSARFMPTRSQKIKNKRRRPK